MKKYVGSGLTVVVLIVAFAPQYMPYVRAFAWQADETFVCDGNDDIHLSGKHGKIAYGPALRIEGNCELTCTECVLEVEGVGVEIRGNGELTFEGGAIHATETAVQLDGGTLIASEATFQGGEIGIAGRGPTLRHCWVKGGEVGIEVDGGELEARDVTIEGEIALRATGNGDATCRGGEIKGKKLSIEATRNGEVRLERGVAVTGPVRRRNNGSIEGLSK